MCPLPIERRDRNPGRGACGLLLTVLVAASLVHGGAGPEKRDSGATPTVQRYPGELSPDDAVAMLNGEPILMGEVDAQIALEVYRLQADIHRLIRTQCREIADRRLLRMEAARMGITVEELTQRHEAQQPEVRESEIDAYLERHPPAVSSVEARTRVANYLRERGKIQARLDLVDTLRDRSDYDVLIDAPVMPRLEIDLGERPVRGAADAPVTIAHFGDFHSSGSLRAIEYVDRLKSAFPNQLRHAHLPTVREGDERALREALWALAAADGDRFWELHDRLFALRGKFSIQTLDRLAAGLNLGVTSEDLEARYSTALRKQLEAATGRGIPRSSVLFVNGRYFNPSFPFERLQELVREEIAAARQDRPVATAGNEIQDTWNGKGESR